MLTNYPKIGCPFVRRLSKVDRRTIDKNHRRAIDNNNCIYLVTPEINPLYDWVFMDPNTIAVEKLDGMNVKVKTEKGRLIAIQNRLNPIDPLSLKKRNLDIVEGVFKAMQKGYLNDNCEMAGELIGPKLQGNPYQLESHIWYPFEKAVTSLSYRSWHEHERTFDNLSIWFKNSLKSRFMAKRVGYENAGFAEGVVFYNLKRKEKGLTWRAKLRRDMFEWYYF